MTLINSFLLLVKNQQPWYEELFEFIIDFSIFWFFIIILIVYIILKRTKKDVHSHWNKLIDNFKYSSKDFYDGIKREILSHGISGISTSYVQLSEGGTMSRKRLYVRVIWKDFQYDICAAPFGDGFFISWWLIYKTPVGKIILNRVPFIGNWLVQKFYPITFYKIDTASMFQTYCHQSVLNIVDSITKDKGVRALTENERKPIMKDIFKR
jgi:hypothetical protein